MGKLAAVFLGLVAAAALAFSLEVSVQTTFTNCASVGSSASTIAGGKYLVTVNDEATFMCIADSASTCATLGVQLPPGTVMLLDLGAGGKSVSCRSASSSGDLQFTKANY